MHLECLNQTCLGLSLVVSVSMDTCWSLQTLTGVKLVNTNVKLVMSVAIEQRRQPFMCCVSLWMVYCFYCRYFELEILIGEL